MRFTHFYALFMIVVAIGCHKDALQSFSMANETQMFSDLDSKTPMNMMTWKSLDNSARESLLNGDGLDAYSGLTFLKISSDDVAQSLSAAELHYFTTIENFIRENSYMDFSYAEHSTIGIPAASSLNLLALSPNQILGARIAVMQQGCEMPGELESYEFQAFKSKNEALVAGCRLRDISWTANGFFDEAGIPISYDESFSWTGY